MISWFVVFTVLGIVGVNLPDSVLHDDVRRLTGRYIQATGLDQNWAVFSQPRTISAYVEAKVDFADGSSRTVPITTSRGLGSLVDYRWQKYEEVIRPDGHPHLWLLYARYVARQARTEGRPVRVTLMRRFAETFPPGPGPARAPFQRSAYFVYDVPGAS